MIEHLLCPLVPVRFLNDMRYREGHLRVVNALPLRRVMGVHIPDMKRLAAKLSREGAEACIAGFEAVDAASLAYEEMMVWGFMINLVKCTVERRREMLVHFVPTIDNWALCDSFTSHAKWMARLPKTELWEMLKPWFRSSREFEVRFAIVASMCYVVHEEWSDELAAEIEHLDYDSIESDYTFNPLKQSAPQQGTVQGLPPYYVRMGVAWLLATLLARFPRQTRKFVNRATLPADIVRLYIRKARESYRTRGVSPF